MQGHQDTRSGQVTIPDKNFTIASQLQCLREVMKLSEYDKVIGTSDFVSDYISDF